MRWRTAGRLGSNGRSLAGRPTVVSDVLMASRQLLHASLTAARL